MFSVQKEAWVDLFFMLSHFSNWLVSVEVTVIIAQKSFSGRSIFQRIKASEVSVIWLLSST